MKFYYLTNDSFRLMVSFSMETIVSQYMVSASRLTKQIIDKKDQTDIDGRKRFHY